jgi:hypothetical protein
MEFISNLLSEINLQHSVVQKYMYIIYILSVNDNICNILFDVGVLFVLLYLYRFTFPFIRKYIYIYINIRETRTGNQDWTIQIHL